jgi:hypothetical protein
MTLIKINIENKDKVKQKSEILNKLNKIQKLVDNDEKYNELVYNIVTNATLHKKNIKINLDNYGNYKVIDSKNKILSGGFFNLGSLFQKTNAQEPTQTKNNLTEPVQKSQAEQESDSDSDSEEKQEQIQESDSEEQEPTSDSEEQEQTQEQTQDSEEEKEKEPEPLQKQEQTVPIVPETTVQEAQTTVPAPEVDSKENISFWGSLKKKITGGNKDQYSSDEESISFNKYQTMMFHQDDNDDNLMQHMKNMTNKKYLNNLTTQELKDIMKSNQMRVTNNGSYYNKKEMVGKIYNFYK